MLIVYMYIWFILYVLGSVSASSFPSRLLEDSVRSDDVKHLQGFFEKQLKGTEEPFKIHNALVGLKSLGLSPADPDSICKTLTNNFDTTGETFHRVCGAYMLGKSCKVPTEKIKVLLKNKDLGKTGAEELFEDVMIRKCTDLQIDLPQTLKLIDKVGAEDKSPSGIALILQTAAQLDLKSADAKRFIPSISVALEQADEIEGKLFYERGLYTSAMVAIGIFDFLHKYGSVSDVPEPQLTKLLNFIITKRYSNNLRAAAYLRKAISLATQNRIFTPVVFEIAAAEGAVRLATGGELPKASPLLQLKLATLSGEPITGESASLTAHGLHAIPDGTLVGPTERGLFSYSKIGSNFQLSLAPPNTGHPSRGYYWIDLDANWKVANDTRVLLGGINARLPLRIVTNASVVSSKLTLSDAAHERHVSDIALKPGERYSASSTPGGAIGLDVDHQARLTVHLSETSTSSSAGATAELVPLVAHQVFVQLTHQTTKQAITFVCNKANSNGNQVPGSQAYELFLDPKKSAAEFDNLPGVYSIELIVGDSLISQPLIWHMADLQLSFVGQSGEESQRRAASAKDVSRQQLASAAASKAARSLVGTGPGLAKPPIEHLFRPSEKRAPSFIARLFTVACAIPFLGLLVAWAIIGLNLGNFVFSFSGLVFHTGLIGIFCLYYVYWCYLDMFTTLGYLAVIAVPTFLAGNSLLRSQLALRSSKK